MKPRFLLLPVARTVIIAFERSIVIRIGPAGWNYKDWAGIVYPAKRPVGFSELAARGNSHSPHGGPGLRKEQRI